MRENVLVKAKKLYDWQLELIRNRFQYAAQLIENRHLRRRLDWVMAHGVSDLGDMDLGLTAVNVRPSLPELAGELERLSSVPTEPTVLEDDRFNALLDIAQRFRSCLPVVSRVRSCWPPNCTACAYAAARWMRRKSRKSALMSIHSFNFLVQIPWTRDLQAVPGIAAAHHEKSGWYGLSSPVDRRGNPHSGAHDDHRRYF